MRAVDLHNACITGISSRVDKSLRLSVVTPELTTAQRAAFMELQGVNARILIHPTDAGGEETEVVKPDSKGKTPSQKLRAAIFGLYTREHITKPFEAYYVEQMNKLIATYAL